jgi:hypothetical protein
LERGGFLGFDFPLTLRVSTFPQVPLQGFLSLHYPELVGFLFPFAFPISIKKEHGVIHGSLYLMSIY